MQVAYAIGVARPVSLLIDTFGTERVDTHLIASLVNEHFDLRPAASSVSTSTCTGLSTHRRRPMVISAAPTLTCHGSGRTGPLACGRQRAWPPRQSPRRSERPAAMTVLNEHVAPAIACGADAGAGPSPDIGRLTMSCVDGPGIIALVASFLHRRGANIIQSDQSTGPTGGQFFLRTEFHLPGLRDELDPLKSDFDARVASTLGATFRLCDASVPVRVAIFVSRRGHCLVDLLWRARRGELPIEIVTVISNHCGLRADVASFGVPFEVIPVTKATTQGRTDAA